MFNLSWSKLFRRKNRKKNFSILFVLLFGLWSIILGLGLALALDRPAYHQDLNELSNPVNLYAQSPNTNPERYQTGKAIYLETCGSCHIPIDPGVLPTESWQKILENPNNHYGTSLPLIRITQVLIWDYLRTFSRTLSKDEPVPAYIGQSRYFRILHPGVDIPKPVTLKTCVNCHPNAAQFDYRTVIPQWDNAPPASQKSKVKSQK